MFTVYTPEEIQEIVTASCTRKKPAKITQEEKLSNTLKHVRLFDTIELTQAQRIMSDPALNRYSAGDTIDMGGDYAQTLQYIISGGVSIPLGSETEVELGKDQIFGEVGAFMKKTQDRIVTVTQDNTMIFSFQINKRELNRDTMEGFVKFYENLLEQTTNKLLWFEII